MAGGRAVGQSPGRGAAGVGVGSDEGWWTEVSYLSDDCGRSKCVCVCVCGACVCMYEGEGLCVCVRMCVRGRTARVRTRRHSRRVIAGTLGVL